MKSEQINKLTYKSKFFSGESPLTSAERGFLEAYIRDACGTEEKSTVQEGL